ncbi:MAG TPA: Crp/Fnr family transcriptional regulator [Rubrivivax sp.]|nr:Crp/Fnr family transcriptional regulator [Rubrivivax sp.]
MTIIKLYRVDAPHPQAQACAACSVRGQSLFGALDKAGLDYIHAYIANIQLESGKPLYEAGAHGHALYTVREGIVRFERVTERGDRRIVRLAGRGDLVGQEVLLRRPYADDAVACTNVQLCRIPAHLVDGLASQHPALVRELMVRWQRALEDSEAWLSDLATGPARRRMLRLLHKLDAYAGPDRLVWMPRRDEIGAMLDVTFETASRLISGLRREGVLELEGPRQARLDAAALRQALRREDER